MSYSAAKLLEKTDDRFLGLFISRSGAGKTTAALSFPKPLLDLDLDGRIRGGLNNKWIDPKGIEYEIYPPSPVRLNDNKMTSKPSDVYTKLNKDLELVEMRQLGIGGMEPLQTLLLDSLTFETIGVLLDSIPLTHSDNKKGKWMGGMPMAGPADYGFQSVVITNTLSFLKSLRVPNIIVTAHIVNKWGKDPNSDNDYAENVIVGEQLVMTDKLAEMCPAYFDHIFKFRKTDAGNRTIHEVKCHGELERTAFPDIPYGWQTITGVNFYEWMMKQIKKGEPVNVGGVK